MWIYNRVCCLCYWGYLEFHKTKLMFTKFYFYENIFSWQNIAHFKFFHTPKLERFMVSLKALIHIGSNKNTQVYINLYNHIHIQSSSSAFAISTMLPLISSTSFVLDVECVFEFHFCQWLFLFLIALNQEDNDAGNDSHSRLADNTSQSWRRDAASGWRGGLEHDGEELRVESVVRRIRNDSVIIEDELTSNVCKWRGDDGRRKRICVHGT